MSAPESGTPSAVLAGQPSAAALSHEADCKCAACRAFWWELFVVRDERAVMIGDPAEVVR